MMAGSRTIKTLTVLLAAMTVGAFSLMVLETAPIPPASANLAALKGGSVTLGAVEQTTVPLQTMIWRNIIVHTSGLERRDIARDCHFVIEGGEIKATDRWKRQTSGNHIYVPGFDYDANSIGVCVIGDFSSRAPGNDQLQALATLVRALQQRLRITNDRVYTYRELVPSSASPGDAFPADFFKN